MNDKIFALIANVGETIVLIASAIWITKWEWTAYLYAIGAFLFCVGRICEKRDINNNVALKRLYSQRLIGLAMLLLSATMMCFYKSSRTAWILPFVIFVVFELYTAFRIPAEEKKEKQSNKK